jgi:hypothetical protein
LGSHAEALFEDPGFAASGLWNVPWWRQAVRRLRRGENHLAWTLWRPVIAEAWRMHFVDRARGMRTQSAFA